MNSTLNWKRIFAGIALITLLPVFCFAQYYDYIPVGARAIGMGGTGIASARGGEAIYYNPALMGMSETVEFMLSGRFLETEIIRTSDPYNNHQVDNQISTHFAAVILPLPIQEKRYALGISHARPMDPLVQYTESSGSIDLISPAFSIRLTDKLRFGGAVNIWSGKLEYADTVAVEYSNPVGHGRTWFYSGYEFEVSGISTSWSLAYTAYEHYQQHKVYVGLMARAPLELETRVTYDQSPPAGAVNPDDYPSIDIPAVVGFGMCWVIYNKTTLSADYEYRILQGEQQLEPGLATNSLVPGVVQPFNESTHHFMFGAEHRLRVGEVYVPLRMGFRRYETPFTSFEDDPVVGQALSLGIGLLTDTFSMNLAYERSDFTQQARSGGTNTYQVTNGYRNSRLVLDVSVNIEEIW